MTEINNSITQEPANKEIAEYLRKVSQCIYNLRKIIDAHLIEPIEEDKDLNAFFLDEIYLLNKLLKKPVGMAIVSTNNIKISQDLMFNRGKTKSAQKQLEDADDYIRVILSRVQRMRHKYYGPSIPTQGLEEGSLKIFLTDFVDKKTKVSKEPKKVQVEILDSNSSSARITNRYSRPLEDIVVGPLRYKSNGSIYFNETLLELRLQINALCGFFMQNHKKLLENYLIEDEIIDAVKRSTTKRKNINKYVNELHTLLKKHFRREVIFNHKKQGYIFDIERSS